MKRSEIEGYRDLLSGDGTSLVKIVQQVLSDVQIETTETEPGFPIDLIKEGKVAVEVTGITDKVDSDTDKIFQIIQFKEKYHKGEKIILIANTYKRLVPSEREGKMHFTPEVAEFLRLREVCAMTSVTLFSLWKAVRVNESKISEVKQLVWGTNGVLSLTRGSDLTHAFRRSRTP
jgi:hypothetical protein